MLRRRLRLRQLTGRQGERPRRVATEGELAELAGALAAELRPGDVVHLRGQLGSGKTTFVRYAARALGATDAVTSPTFSLAHIYTGGRASIAHLDLYRSAVLTIEAAADLAHYLEEDRIVFVEWPEAGAGVLPAATHTVTLAHVAGDEEARIVVVERPERSRHSLP